MAPGPPDKFSNNRFHILGDFIDNPSKKQKHNEYPDLPTPNNTKNNPKYVIISSNDNNKRLSDLSPFAIKKCIEGISTEINSISQLRDGNLLVLTRNTRVAEKFLRSKSFANLCQITCKLHTTLNSVKGVIYAPCLINVPESEIVEEMKDQGVIEVYKFTKPNDEARRNESGNAKTNDEHRIATGKIILTFDLYRLPTSVDVAWYKCKVEHYIPNPMRCKDCQRLGHTKKRCKGNPTCPNCSYPPHDPEKCTRLFCINCSGEHSSKDIQCPRYIQMKEILKIKTKNYCSIGEARRKYKESNPIITTNQNNTYASVTLDSPTKRKDSSKNIKTSATNTIQDSQPSTSKDNHTRNHNLITPTTLKQNEKTSENPSKSKNTSTETTTSINTSTHNNEKISKNNSIDNNEKAPPGTNLMSPISSLTKSLIDDNKYFLPLESIEEITMELSSP